MSPKLVNNYLIYTLRNNFKKDNALNKCVYAEVAQLVISKSGIYSISGYETRKSARLISVMSADPALQGMICKKR